MSNDDIFRIIYTILKELYAHRKDGTQVPREDISPERFQISDSYWISIICELSDNGYISGVKYRETKTGNWDVQPGGDTAKDKEAAEFVQGCMDDMQDT